MIEFPIICVIPWMAVTEGTKRLAKGNWYFWTIFIIYSRILTVFLQFKQLLHDFINNDETRHPYLW
jgi:hypothetical protein